MKSLWSTKPDFTTDKILSESRYSFLASSASIVFSVNIREEACGNKGSYECMTRGQGTRYLGCMLAE